MGVLRKIKNFFSYVLQATFPIVRLNPSYNLGIGEGKSLYFDAYQATPAKRITGSGGNIDVYYATSAYNRLSNPCYLYSPLSWTDNAGTVGSAARRWQNIFAGTEVGVHNGTAFTAGFFRASDASHYCKMPKLTTAERDAMATAWGAGEKGYTIYNSTTNVLETWNGGAWV